MTVKSGFLQKLSGFLKRDWKRQYFVLHQDGKLIYCERAGEEYINGRQVSVKHGCHRIDYGHEVEVDVQNKTGGRAACLFSINTTNKTIFLLADTEQDARDWVQKLKGVHQSAMVMGSYGPTVQPIGQPGMIYHDNQQGMQYHNSQSGMSYPNSQSGMLYPNSQSGMLYPNSQSGMPYPNRQSGMPYPNSQSGMMYPNSQSGMPYPNSQSGMPYPMTQPDIYPSNQPQMTYNQPGVPYPTGTAYPTQQYGQPTGPYQTQPYVQTTPQYYQTVPPGSYPVYQQQQVHQSNRSGGLSSRRGLLAGAAGGALAGGLLGYGMGRATGGFGGGSFDGCDSDFGGGCDSGGCD